MRTASTAPRTEFLRVDLNCHLVIPQRFEVRERLELVLHSRRCHTVSRSDRLLGIDHLLLRHRLVGVFRASTFLRGEFGSWLEKLAPKTR